MEDNLDRGVIHRELDTDAENPGVQVAQIIEDVTGKESTDLTTMHECVDGILDNLFSNPPSPDAQLQIEFTYEGHRITIEQDGNAKFVKME